MQQVNALFWQWEQWYTVDLCTLTFRFFCFSAYELVSEAVFAFVLTSNIVYIGEVVRVCGCGQWYDSSHCVPVQDCSGHGISLNSQYHRYHI